MSLVQNKFVAIHLHACKMMMHHQRKCHSKMSCVSEWDVLLMISWNINSTGLQYFNVKSYILTCMYPLFFHWNWNIFNLEIQCTHLHTHIHNAKRVEINKFRFDARVKFMRAKWNEKSTTIHSWMCFLSRRYYTTRLIFT